MNQIIGNMSKVFPPGVESAKIVRLMIAYNVLSSLYRMQSHFYEVDYKHAHGQWVTMGDQYVAFVITMATLKESIDAFTDLPKKSKEIVKRKIPEAYENFLVATDKQNPESLYQQSISTIRHKTGFHWDRNEIEIALEERRINNDIVIAETANESDNDTLGELRYRLADTIMASTAFDHSNSRDSHRNDVKDLIATLRNFLTIAELVIAEYLRDKECRRINKRSM